MLEAIPSLTVKHILENVALSSINKKNLFYLTKKSKEEQ